MQYRLKLTPKAQQSLRMLPERLRSEVSEILIDLREDPKPVDGKRGRSGRELDQKWIIRVNGLRIVYQVNEADRIVVVLAVCPRSSNTYLNL